MQMLAVDGVEQGVVERLDQYLAFLQVPTQPPQSTVTPPPPPAEEELPPPPPLEELPPPSPQEPPPRKAAKTSTKEIHIDQDGEKYGPYNLDKVNDFLEEGRISPTALAWKKGLSDWIPITEIDGVVAPTTDGPPPRPPSRSAEDAPPPRKNPQSANTAQTENTSGEKIYYENKETGVLVSNTRYVFVDHNDENTKTVVIKNITSVQTGTYEVEKTGIIPIIVVIGAGMFIKLLDDEMFGGDIPDNYYNIPFCIVLAILVVVFLCELFSGDDYYYSVDNVTASGNEQSYTSDDKQEIDEIVNALNEAIING